MEVAVDTDTRAKVMLAAMILTYTEGGEAEIDTALFQDIAMDDITIVVREKEDSLLVRVERGIAI